MRSKSNDNKFYKLAYFPDWSKANPYQKLLYEEINATGIDCCGFQGSEFSFAWIIKNKFKFEFIHLHWLHGIYFAQPKVLRWASIVVMILKIILAKFAGYKILWTVHNIVSHDSINSKQEITINKVIARVVNKVIVHCEYARGIIVDNWGIVANKIMVIPHGSYIGYYPNKCSHSDAKKRLKICEDEFIFLFFGMLRGYKGVKELLDSFEKVRRIKKNVHLVIAGKPQNEFIRREIEQISSDKNISLHLQHISDNDIQFFFNASDVVVLPYLNILTSGAAILALSFGKPVIAPAKGCLPELLDESNGFLYDNRKGLTSAMFDAATKENLSDMGKKAIERAKSLSWEKIVADHYIPILRRR